VSSATSPHALAQRRRAIMGRAETQRSAIGNAWSYFEVAALRGEARARRTIAWSRRIAGVVIVIGAWRTLRSPTQPGLIGRTMGTVATLQKLTRLLRLTGWVPK